MNRKIERRRAAWLLALAIAEALACLAILIISVWFISKPITEEPVQLKVFHLVFIVAAIVFGARSTEKITACIKILERQ